MYKKIILSAILVTTVVFIGNVSAIPLSGLSIINDDYPGWRWDTNPTEQWSSPIGVATSLSAPIVQAGTGSKSIDGLVDISLGGSVYLFIESFPSLSALFINQPYTIYITTNPETHAAAFGFGSTYGSFNAPGSTTPFQLEFLGFTGSGVLTDVSDKVKPFISYSDPGLEPNGSPDAVYKLTNTMVPEPATMLLLGSGLLGLLGLRRKFKK